MAIHPHPEQHEKRGRMGHSLATITLLQSSYLTYGLLDINLLRLSYLTYGLLDITLLWLSYLTYGLLDITLLRLSYLTYGLLDISGDSKGIVLYAVPTRGKDVNQVVPTRGKDVNQVVHKARNNTVTKTFTYKVSKSWNSL